MSVPAQSDSAASTRAAVRAHLRALYASAPRDQYFEAVHAATTEYRNETDERVDSAAVLTELGYAVIGRAEAPGNSVAWCERS